jgi:glutaminyl-tRNA synthetase
LCQEIGITRSDGEIHLHKLDHHIRADLDATSPRALAVLEPLRLVLTNLPTDHFQAFDAKVLAKLTIFVHVTS